MVESKFIFPITFYLSLSLANISFPSFNDPLIYGSEPEFYIEIDFYDQADP